MVFTAALLLLVLLWRGLVALGRVALHHQERSISIFAQQKMCFANCEREFEGKDVPEEEHRNRVVEEGSSRLGEGDCNSSISHHSA
jgi:hypothetical protein